MYLQVSDAVNVTMGLTIQQLIDVNIHQKTATGIFWFNYGGDEDTQSERLSRYLVCCRMDGPTAQLAGQEEICRGRVWSHQVSYDRQSLSVK